MPTLTKIKEAIPSTPVVMVSKSYCPFCRKAKVTILESKVFFISLAISINILCLFTLKLGCFEIIQFGKRHGSIRN